ncbi:hydroxymethylbilane synthase [Marinoscillum sp. MHG1-6]|uniref:hydroxymethylbilane synthase n=1 Tax=Marinoscillum sp. MHG1-6 TaxID=2959627 RepID=UPI002157B9FD|nr:hydroxymethylbilane synthase [Marinoscillum sp. MHG1-6]
MDTIRIGTRKSKLALWQAEYVAEKLQNGGLKTELVLMETKGDMVLDVSIAKIGSKGVFTEELEEKLANGEIDIAVHSAKDMQSSLAEGFDLIAFSEREEVNDVIVSDREIDLSKEIVLGTSSTRRIATLKHFYPNVRTVEVRGNLQTRIQKMRDGLCDGLLLAFAGVHRMGYHEMIKKTLSLDEFTPAVGQGSVAIESHVSVSEEKRSKVRELINHPETEKRLLAERAFLKKLEGGCSIPVFALAHNQGENIKIDGGIVSLDGQTRIVRSLEGPDPEEIGVMLAEQLLAAGGDHILSDIKKQLKK